MFFFVSLLLLASSVFSCNAMDRDSFKVYGKNEIRTKLSPRNSARKTSGVVRSDVVAIISSYFKVDPKETFESYSIENDDICTTSVDLDKKERIVRILRCARIRYHKL